MVRNFLVLAALLAPTAVQAAPWSKFPFAAGEGVVVSGSVTDSRGLALTDLEVVLELSDTRLSLRPFGRAPRAIHRVTTRTDATGTYSTRIAWDRSWDRAELVVGVPLLRTDGAKVHVLARLDVTRRLAQGSPAVIGAVIEDTSFLDNHRSFLASLSTDSMRQAYQHNGRPDRVEQLATPDVDEVSWWYYGAGRVLRFRDGVLIDSQSFAPVPPPTSTNP
jgi:hypothetical protein